MKVTTKATITHQGLWAPSIRTDKTTANLCCWCFDYRRCVTPPLGRTPVAEYPRSFQQGLRLFASQTPGLPSYRRLHVDTYIHTYLNLVVLRLRYKLDQRCISVSIQN